MTTFAGKVALVTGAARRVGRAIAEELAAQGASVALHYHHSSDQEVAEALAACRAHGIEAAAFQADLADTAAIERLFAAVQARFGRLDILVNSASAFQRRHLMEVTLADWDLTMAVNLTAPFLCTQAAVRQMQAQAAPGGVIINIGDQGVEKPWLDYAHHGISKAGLWALTQITAASEGPLIRANMVIPGLVMRSEGIDEAKWQAYGAAIPVGHVGSAGDVARAVCYLAAEPFITGVALRVDGGEGLI